jgi:hypothetical protein
LSPLKVVAPKQTHRGEQLAVEYEWSGSEQPQWFEITLALASSGSCEHGPLLYSHYLEGQPWNVNYYLGPWYAQREDVRTVAPPPLPDDFRICVSAVLEETVLREEYLFEWLP